MLKITKRLNNIQEEVYIEMVAQCMKRKSRSETEQFLCDFSMCIFTVLRKIKKSSNIILYNQVLDYMKDWKFRHPSFEVNIYKTKMCYWQMAWILMPQEIMREIHVVVKDICETSMKKHTCWKLSYNSFSSKNINNWIIDAVDNKVCPYCNLSFVYSRTAYKTTAELDHFYNKSIYPLFALNYYNLIPVCHSCNHIKTDQDKDMISPYDKNAYDDIKIKYELINDTHVDYLDLEDNMEILFDGSLLSKEHLNVMHIKEAYDKHKDYAEELIQKINIYNNSSARKLIQDGIGIAFSTTEFEKVYFGKYRYQPEKRILGKMTHDFLKEYLK